MLYTGVTNNLIKRVHEHKEKIVEGFSSKYNVNKLVYFETYNDINLAIKREKQIKGGSRKKKIDLIKKLSGFHFHFSTNNFKISNYQLLMSKIKEFLDKPGTKIEFLDIGGGLPAANEFVYDPEIYQKLPSLISELFPQTKIISEAGRNIVADTVNLVFCI